MKCEDFVPLLTTGRWWQRLWARRHARHCYRCTADAHALAAIQRELGRAEPIPERLRSAWHQAAVAHRPLPAPAWTGWRITGVGLAATALILIVAGVLLRKSTVVPPAFGPNSIEIVGTADQAPPSPTRAIDATHEFAQLLGDVDGLRSEIQRLSRKAELLEARRQAALMLVTYSQW